MNTVHLKPPAGFSACGLGNPIRSENTTEIEQVTCRKCRQTVAGRLRLETPPAVPSGRPPDGDRPKIKTGFSLSAEIFEQLQREPNRSEVVEKALREYYNRGIDE